MNQRICLVIIFNHRYDHNIEILEKIYRGRFETIYYLVPFYDGNRERVIPVYESSHQFQGYVAQAMAEFYHEKYTHYLFIGDDLILNPAINQDNFFEHFKMKPEYSYCPECRPLGRFREWDYEGRMYNAVRAFQIYSGTNYKGEIPEPEEAFKRAYDLGYTENDFLLNTASLFHGGTSKKGILNFMYHHPKHVIKLWGGTSFLIRFLEDTAIFS